MPKGSRQRLPKTGDLQLFSLRLPQQLWAELSVFAKLKGRSLNDLLGEVIAEYWENEPTKPSVARLVKASGAAPTAKPKASVPK